MYLCLPAETKGERRCLLCGTCCKALHCPDEIFDSHRCTATKQAPSLATNHCSLWTNSELSKTHNTWHSQLFTRFQRSRYSSFNKCMFHYVIFFIQCFHMTTLTAIELNSLMKYLFHMIMHQKG